MGWSEEDERREVVIISRIKDAYLHARRDAKEGKQVATGWQEYLERNLGREIDPTQES